MIKSLLKNEFIYKNTPGFVKKLGRRMIPYSSYIETVWKKENQFIGTEYEWGYNFGTKEKIGIIYDLSHYHKFYIAACVERKISFEVLKIHDTNWIDIFKSSKCDAFLVWPTVVNTVWKKMFDDRLHFLVNTLGMRIFPELESLWIYENKSRVRDFCILHNIKIPTTEIFYREDEAISYLKNAKFPLVLKLDQAAASHGVWILKSFSESQQLIRKIFRKGLTVRRGDPRDRRWGQVIFQDFLPNVDEWRIVRVGDTYFCRFKHKKGDFHSGSGKVSWAKPTDEMLNYVQELTNRLNIKSAAVDLFINATTNEMWVNEIQAMFGEIKKSNTTRGEEKMGKYFFSNGEWKFEQGYFYDNACANLRLDFVLDSLNK